MYISIDGCVTAIICISTTSIIVIIIIIVSSCIIAIITITITIIIITTIIVIIIIIIIAPSSSSSVSPGRRVWEKRVPVCEARARPWLRTNGVSANGAHCKSDEFWQMREKGTPWHFWEDKRRLTGVPKKSVKKQ